MSSVEKRIRDGKVTWLARWRDPDGRQRKASFAKQSEAKRHAAAMEADAARGVYIDQDDRTTVGQECRAWLERRSVGPDTYKRLDRFIRNHIEAVPLGTRRLVAVRPSEVQAWVSDRARVMAPSSLAKVVSILRSACADAVADRKLAASPAVRLTLPRAEPDRVVPLSVAQVLAVVEAADALASRYRAMVIVQAGLGLRIGELLGLRVSDVDFLRRTVRVEHQSHKTTRALVKPKTVSSRRRIPLPQWVADALAVHLAAHPPSTDIECSCPREVTCSRSRSGLIFHTRTNRPIAQDYYCERSVFGKFIDGANTVIRKANAIIRKANAMLPAGAAKAAELPELPSGTTTHDLRHHFASVLLAAGESVVAVAEWMGHRNATLVLSTYGHLMPNSEDRMRRAIDEAYLATPSRAPTVPPRSAVHS
ncbi:MAG: tyrosine-type recombinase/integrase [Pseudonocardiaceae bacterium]